MKPIKRRTFLALAGAAAASPLAPPVRAAEKFKWKMVTSWPKNLPGPGVTAQRLADRIATLSDGRLIVKLYGAGELVPALEVLDAVNRGVAEMGHTAALFWQGKMPASVFFTAVPFGLTPTEHAAWIYHGGGQALWDELYSDFGIKPFMAGNTGIGMAGWFKRELAGLTSLKGLKYRIPGLGGEIFRRLGALPVIVPPGEIFSALQSGLIDAAEFVGPWSDMALGLYQVAPYYYWPGIHEPNGTGECLVNQKSFASLPHDLQEIVANACMAENAYALAEAQWQNAKALDILVQQHGVQLRGFPEDILQAARATAQQVLSDLAKQNALSRRIYRSFETARQQAMGWSRISIQALLQARAGS